VLDSPVIQKSMSKKSVLLLGGTGAIGVYLQAECLGQGYMVYVTTRSEQQSVTPNLHYIIGNAKNCDFLKQTITSRSYSVIVDFMVYTTREFNERVDLLLGSNSHYIFVSTYRVFSTVEECPITETTPFLLDVIIDEEYLATDEYALAKARQERILRNRKRNNWSIVRPSITYSTNRFQLGTLEANVILSRASNCLPVPIPTEVINKKTTMTWAGDVAKMIERLMLNENAYREDFNVLTNESISWREVADIYKNAVNLEVKEVSLERFQKLRGNIWQLKYDRMIARVCSNDKILAATELKQEMLMPVRKGIFLELNNNKKQSIKLSTINRTQGRVDRVLNIIQWPFRASIRESISYIFGRVALLDLILLTFKR